MTPSSLDKNEYAAWRQFRDTRGAIDGSPLLPLSQTMSTRDRIVDKLTQAFAPTRLAVADESQQHAGHAGHRLGGETHFRVTIMADAFRGKSRLDRHRMVNAALADELKPGGVHALAIHASAPGE